MDSPNPKSVDASSKPAVGSPASAEPAGATGDDPGDATVTGEPAGEQAAPSSAGEADDIAVPDEPYDVLILGDSLAATGFGVLLAKRLDDHPHVRCFRKGKSASGLARPDFFDWMAEAKRQVTARKPDLVVVIMGGNDGQDLTSKRKKGGRVRWQADDWEAAYRERLDAFVDVVLDGEDRRLLWLGLPFMDLRSLERKLVTIRELQRAAVAERGDVAVYLDTTALMSDGKDRLPEYVRVGKKQRKLREDDGIHFTMSGSEYFADKVYPEVLSVLRLSATQE